MGRKAIVAFFVMIGLFVLSGCASTLNPYHGDFTCPQAEQGKCVPIQEAYKESLDLSSSQKKILLTEKENKNVSSSSDNSIPIAESYAESLFSRLQKMLSDPKTPVIAPPKVIRVLVLPYTDGSKKFYDSRYVYVIVEDPQWLFQNLNVSQVEDEH